ncbi:hypothetical protein DEA8626_03538 [Defluviimonas aquaemixtae]|uniref:VOC domain-containing protein n=1 Tax=Albidovulum aquaemixtae TaxID=1542388 RepID=A0A2R8BM33_9RHOB|nr:extradiol dioxygenase [Defluviimonas aquaemixtae]SPH24486.1 hypothetical protein DEA8626_03538 [Defluviimonas aquaemixtae]
MINGAHVVVYSADAGADRAFLREVMGLSSVDAGDGWLIFALPPAEVAVHPAETGGSHELFLMCDDIDGLRTDLLAKYIEIGDVSDEGWGRLAVMVLPGGGKLGIYEPRHARP